MSTSGVFIFNPTFAGLFDEACERAGIDPRSTVQDHIGSAKMSLNLMLIEWAAVDGDALYRTANGSAAPGIGINSFTLPAGGWDIIGDDMMIAGPVSSNQRQVSRMSREDYLFIANKTQPGQPTQFYVDRSLLNTPTVVLWPVPDAAYTFSFDYMRYCQTVTMLGENVDVENMWLDATAAGLARRLAAKYNVQRVPLLETDYNRAYALARRIGSGNSQIVVSVRGFGSSRPNTEAVMARRYNFKALDQRTGRLERACTLLEDGERARLKTKEPDQRHPLSEPLTVGLDRAQIVKGMSGERKAEDQAKRVRLGEIGSLDLVSSHEIPILVVSSGGLDLNFTLG